MGNDSLGYALITETAGLIWHVKMLLERVEST